MWSARVIEAFDILEDRVVQVTIGTKITPVGFFFFEIFEETFAAGVIKRISLFSRRMDNIPFIK